MSTKKVLIIGFDGATFDLIDPWVREGNLSAIVKCMQHGTRSILLSTPLSNSAQAWSTMVTGKNPGKHGIFDFFERKPDSYDVRFVNASFRKGKSLWEIISDSGKKIIVMNVPMSYPPSNVNGIILPGLDSPGITDNFAYPANIMDEIRQEVGEYVVEPGIWGFIRQGRQDIALQKLLETIEIRKNTAKYLLAAYPWDFFMIVFTESDKVQHHFWKYMDRRSGPNNHYKNAIKEVYQALDNALKEILDLVDKDTYVFIISDHGAGPSTNKTFFINRWLGSEGLLKFKRSKAGRKLITQVIKWIDGQLKTKLPRGAKEVLARTFPRLRSKVESVLSLSNIDWSSTKAYSRENQPAICINLKGREPFGIVEPGDDFDKIRGTIIQKLSALICPETREKIVDQVSLKEDVFWGEETNKSPDIIFKWKDHRYIHRPTNPYSKDGFIKILNAKELELSESFHRPSGVHRDEGILIGLGPGIRAGKSLSHAKLMDIAPTLLYTFGIPIPGDMDGSVIIDIFEENFTKNRPVLHTEVKEEPPAKTKEVYDVNEEAAVRDRLKGLGYID
ncbi:MAG: hypothetical protein A2Y66_02885 [Nitrospirae bacterium RBG_13_41_22]|nr:MAG: hypothetical protein A2Y66_02885 [Nitrospirae bacterium RBG_13_41_22]